MSAGLLNNLLVQTLVSFDPQDEAALLERVKRMETKDRYELTTALDAISAALAQNKSQLPLSERGVETLLLVDDPEAPINQEYNYKYDWMAIASRAHCNPKMMEKIKSVRSQILKAYPEDPTQIVSGPILSALAARTSELDERLREQKANYRPEILQGCLDSLTLVDNAFRELAQQGQKTNFKMFLDGFAQTLGKAFDQDSHVVQETKSISQLLTLLNLNCQSLEELRQKVDEKGINIIDAELKGFRAKSKDPAREFLLKFLEGKLKAVREQLEEQFNKSNSARQAALSSLEEEKPLLQRRLERYRSFLTRQRERLEKIDQELKSLPFEIKVLKAERIFRNALLCIIDPANLKKSITIDDLIASDESVSETQFFKHFNKFVQEIASVLPQEDSLLADCKETSELLSQIDAAVTQQKSGERSAKSDDPATAIFSRLENKLVSIFRKLDEQTRKFQARELLKEKEALLKRLPQPPARPTSPIPVDKFQQLLSSREPKEKKE